MRRQPGDESRPRRRGRRSPRRSTTSARTGTYRPCIFTWRAPSASWRPRVPAAWYPVRTTVLRRSGSWCARWCTTRPPVAIPEAEMMMHGCAGGSAHRLVPASRTACSRPGQGVGQVPSARASSGGRSVDGPPVDGPGPPAPSGCRRRPERPGSRPAASSRRARSSTSSVRSTANAGISDEPPRSTVRRIARPGRRGVSAARGCARRTSTRRRPRRPAGVVAAGAAADGAAGRGHR